MPCVSIWVAKRHLQCSNASNASLESLGGLIVRMSETVVNPTVICLTWADALAKNQQELNEANVELDRFASANPENMLDRDPTFRMLRQRVKRLQLERNEIIEKSSSHALNLEALSIQQASFNKPNAPGGTTDLTSRGNKMSQRKYLANPVP